MIEAYVMPVIEKPGRDFLLRPGDRRTAECRPDDIHRISIEGAEPPHHPETALYERGKKDFMRNSYHRLTARPRQTMDRGDGLSSLFLRQVLENFQAENEIELVPGQISQVSDDLRVPGSTQLLLRLPAHPGGWLVQTYPKTRKRLDTLLQQLSITSAEIEHLEPTTGICVPEDLQGVAEPMTLNPALQQIRIVDRLVRVRARAGDGRHAGASLSGGGLPAKQRDDLPGDVAGIDVRGEEHVRRRDFLRLPGPLHRRIGAEFGDILR